MGEFVKYEDDRIRYFYVQLFEAKEKIIRFYAEEYDKTYGKELSINLFDEIYSLGPFKHYIYMLTDPPESGIIQILEYCERETINTEFNSIFKIFLKIETDLYRITTADAVIYLQIEYEPTITKYKNFKPELLEKEDKAQFEYLFQLANAFQNFRIINQVYFAPPEFSLFIALYNYHELTQMIEQFLSEYLSKREKIITIDMLLLKLVELTKNQSGYLINEHKVVWSLCKHGERLELYKTPLKKYQQFLYKKW